MQLAEAEQWFQNEGWTTRRRVEIGDDDHSFLVPLIAERDGERRAVMASAGPPSAAQLKRFAQECRAHGLIPTLAGSQDPETQGLCSAHGVDLVGHDGDPLSDFLKRFSSRPGRPQETVLRAAYPRLDTDADAGAVGGEEAPRRRVARWFVVLLVWLVALMLVSALIVSVF